MNQPSRIKQLDDRTIGHIAAGEVVIGHHELALGS